MNYRCFAFLRLSLSAIGLCQRLFGDSRCGVNYLERLMTRYEDPVTALLDVTSENSRLRLRSWRAGGGSIRESSDEAISSASWTREPFPESTKLRHAKRDTRRSKPSVLQSGAQRDCHCDGSEQSHFVTQGLSKSDFLPSR